MSIMKALAATAGLLRKRHRESVREDTGWYIVMPFWARDRMIYGHGSVEAALFAVQANPNSQVPNMSAVTGAVGIEFVGETTTERHRFPWCPK